MSNNFNSISTLWMYLSLSVNIHQSYRFKINVKLDISNWNFFPVQTRQKIKLDISNWRMSKIPKIPVQIDRGSRLRSLSRPLVKVNEKRGTCVKIVKRVSNIDSTPQSHLSTSNFSIANMAILVHKFWNEWKGSPHLIIWTEPTICKLHTIS